MKRLSASQIFANRGKNFLTPYVIKRYKKHGLAIELSVGEGLEDGTKIYGVTVLEYKEAKNTWEWNFEKTKSFMSQSEAERYINSL